MQAKSRRRIEETRVRESLAQDCFSTVEDFDTWVFGNKKKPSDQEGAKSLSRAQE